MLVDVDHPVPHEFVVDLFHGDSIAGFFIPALIETRINFC